MKIAHVEASNIVPPLISSQVPEKVVGNAPENNLLGNLTEEEEGRVKRIFGSLNLQGIES